MHTWSPEQYLTFASERGRPFVDLVARIGADAPATVVDLGCGPGNLTALLTKRWTRARVTGVDASAEMIGRARLDHPDMDFEIGDLRQWKPERPVEVLISNATLQWLPEHLQLLPYLVEQIIPGGWLAFQVPGNFDEPSHTIRRDIAARAPYLEYTAGVAVPSSHDPIAYLDALCSMGCTADVWETTYFHRLTGPDPVFNWVIGTGARPTLQALPDNLQEQFADEYKRRLAQAYPERAGAVTLPFRRIFAVARTPES